MSLKTACLTSLLLFNKYVLQNKSIWASIAVMFCCAMTSGQVWNKMRNPMLYKQEANGPNYLDNQWKKQYKYESYVVAVFNMIASFGMILMIEARKLRWRWLRDVSYFIGVALLYTGFSCVLWAVRNKRQYPYRLLFY